MFVSDAEPLTGQSGIWFEHSCLNFHVILIIRDYRFFSVVRMMSQLVSS